MAHGGPSRYVGLRTCLVQELDCNCNCSATGAFNDEGLTCPQLQVGGSIFPGVGDLADPRFHT